jgi:hypothetical protein
VAKVTITVEDDARGLLLRIESDPPFPGPGATPEELAAATPAQEAGAEIFARMAEAMSAEGRPVLESE